MADPATSRSGFVSSQLSIASSLETTGWYSTPGSTTGPQDILSNAFEQARSFLSTTLKPAEFQILFGPAQSTSQTTPTRLNTVSDVQSALQQAQTAYECRTGVPADPIRTARRAGTPTQPNATQAPRSRTKVRMWLTGLSGKIMYYGNIFDVMAQHHPEYVALAWGTFKILFMAILNHAEIASKLAKSISQVADLLPQQSLLLILYPTDTMQLCVARLYAHILAFFQAAIKWYRDCKLVHAVKALFQPWELSFRTLYEAIADEAQLIRRMADVAAKAELRDTHLEVIQASRQWEMTKNEMTLLRLENQRLAGMIEMKFSHVDNIIYTLSKEIRLDLSTQRATLDRLHLNQMLSLPIWNQLPTSGESLNYCQSIRRRRRDYTQLVFPKIEQVQKWALERESSVVVLDCYLPLTTKAFMLDMINLIHREAHPIVWALRFPEYWQHRLSVIDLVRILVLQAMQVSGERLLEGSFPVTVAHLREASDLLDWINILDQLLKCTGRTFIVLDAELVSHATNGNRSLTHELIDLIRSRLSCSAKILASSSSLAKSYVEQLITSANCVKLQVDGVQDWRRPRRPRRPAVARRR